jgi:hypothetical protein
MRWCLAAILVALASCSSEPPSDVSDAGVKTCANTSCVAGASCVVPDGTICRCFETGVWSCGDLPQAPGDTGFAFDTGRPPGDALVAPDTFMGGVLTVDVSGCGTKDACAGEDVVAAAEAVLRNLMISCGAYCTNLTLYAATNGCPIRVRANVEWMSGALNCVAKGVTNYRWPCATELHVSTTSCPD